jgi:hypothetical protein
MIAKVCRAQLVVVVGDAVLGDQDRQAALLGEVGERPAECASVDRPAGARKRQARHGLVPREKHARRTEIERDRLARVVVETEVRE